MRLYTFPSLNNARNRFCVLSLIFLVLGGCLDQQAIQTEPLPTAQQWSVESVIVSHDQPQAWLNDLNLPTLNQQVEEAISNNLVLRASKARWQAAQARSVIAGAPLKPQIDASADASRRGLNNNSSSNFSADINASWEIDVWGRLENAEQAAIDDTEAFAADYRAAQLSLAADVALVWLAIIETNLQEQLAQKTTTIFKQSLDVIEERYRRGLNSALDVRLARSDVASAENEVTRRQREKDGQLRRLDLLLGRYPSAELKTATELPRTIAKVPVGLPAELLLRRPDLLAAERRLSAAGERLHEAQKNRLPAIRLTANGGLGSSDLHDLLDWDSLVWNLLAGVVQPIYQGGRLDAERTLATAQHSEAWANYAQSVLIAFREVETALAADDHFVQQLVHLEVATHEAQEAAELAIARYKAGLVDIITLLDAERRAFTAESSLLRTRREHLDNRVALYLALGGDFLPETDQAAVD